MPETPARVSATIVLRRPDRGIPAGASREEVQQALSADPADLEIVRRFCAAHNLQIDRESAPERSVRISAPAAVVTAAFGSPETFVMPPELAGVAIAVLGLDPRPVANPHHPA